MVVKSESSHVTADLTTSSFSDRNSDLGCGHIEGCLHRRLAIVPFLLAKRFLAPCSVILSLQQKYLQMCSA